MLISSGHVQKALTLSNRQFKRLFGVKRQTFNQMLEILQAAFDQLRQRGGKPSAKLQVEDTLIRDGSFRLPDKKTLVEESEDRR